MRKFTKEISALLASVAVGTAAFAGAVSASSEGSVQDSSSETVRTTTTMTTTAVGTMARDDVSVTTTEPSPMTDPIGTMTAPDTTTYYEDTGYAKIGTEITQAYETTTEEYIPTQPIGTIMGDDQTTTTETETTPLPPTAGLPLPPDETIPPLLGDVAPADGDLNNDGVFSLTDIVVFQKWLHGIPGAERIDRWAADLNYDDVVDVYDFALMKRKLLHDVVYDYVEPVHRVEYGSAFYVRAGELPMYVGPDTSYSVLEMIPQSEVLQELGYQDPSVPWVLTKFKGKYGWIRTVDEYNKIPTIDYMAVAEKPVIYLYPEQKTDVRVTLELTESELATTYPKYQNGWNVTAYPDGTLLNKADGTHHKYLFWDSSQCRTHFDFSKGFCVAGSDTERFLKEKLTGMGLTENEMNEFIVYWLPRMEHNAYNLISFQGDAYTNSAKLNITPEPDSICRVFMAYVPLEQAVEIEPQTLAAFERKGFTVVEWGGTELTSQNN